jgi:hypothetical protein
MFSMRLQDATLKEIRPRGPIIPDAHDCADLSDRSSAPYRGKDKLVIALH